MPAPKTPRVYVFRIVGASPGYGGFVAVVSPDIRQATQSAAGEVEKINVDRKSAGYPEVRLEKLIQKPKPLPESGVVYSYDGEA